MAGLLGWTHMESRGKNDADKIQKIAKYCGLIKKDGKETFTIHLLAKRHRKWGTEYVYRIPLGFSFCDFQDKRQNFEDGLNIRSRLWEIITIDDILKLKWNKTILQQIRDIINTPRQRKEIVMDYDGTLIMRVYKSPMPKKVDFDDDLLASCKKWGVCIGESREGRVFHNFEKNVHMIVAGTTRYGKSVFLKNVITTLIHNNPDRVRLHLIDLKGGLAFNRFANCRQVTGVAKDAFEALDILTKIQDEMKERQRIFLSKGYEDITEADYRERDFIIVDEAAELSPFKIDTPETKKAKGDCEKILAEIARIGGGLGYRLVYATQYPTADVLPRQIKQNATSKLCFLLDTATASNVVLDESGAESLPWIKGRAIYKTDRKTVVQAPLITNKYINEVIRPHINIKPKEELNGEPTTRNTSGQDIIKFKKS